MSPQLVRNNRLCPQDYKNLAKPANREELAEGSANLFCAMNREVEPAVVVQTGNGPRQVPLREVRHLLSGGNGSGDSKDPIDQFLQWLGQQVDKLKAYFS